MKLYELLESIDEDITEAPASFAIDPMDSPVAPGTGKGSIDYDTSGIADKYKSKNRPGKPKAATGMQKQWTELLGRRDQIVQQFKALSQQSGNDALNTADNSVEQKKAKLKAQGAQVTRVLVQIARKANDPSWPVDLSPDPKGLPFLFKKSVPKKPTR